MPAVDELILDETILDNVLPCVRCDAGAVYKITAICCGASSFGCAPHEEAWEANARLVFELFQSAYCKQCETFASRFDDAYRVTPI
jgi:hypothetical protein